MEPAYEEPPNRPKPSYWQVAKELWADTPPRLKFDLLLYLLVSGVIIGWIL